MLLSFRTIFLLTSAMRHLLTRAWLRSGGFTSSRTVPPSARDTEKGEGKGRTADAAPRMVEEALGDLLDMPPQVEVAPAELERERVRDALEEQAAFLLLFRAQLRLRRLFLHGSLCGAGGCGGVCEHGVVGGVVWRGDGRRGGWPRGGFLGGAQGGLGSGCVCFCSTCCEDKGCGGGGLAWWVAMRTLGTQHIPAANRR